jgi:hypothetical protein
MPSEAFHRRLNSCSDLEVFTTGIGTGTGACEDSACCLPEPTSKDVGAAPVQANGEEAAAVGSEPPHGDDGTPMSELDEEPCLSTGACRGKSRFPAGTESSAGSTVPEEGGCEIGLCNEADASTCRFAGIGTIAGVFLPICSAPRATTHHRFPVKICPTVWSLTSVKPCVTHI